MGYAVSAPYVAMAPSTPARGPFQVSISRSRGRTKRTKRSLLWRRVEHGHRVRLVEAGEEVEVGGLSEVIGRIGVAKHFGPARDDGQTLAHGFRKALPAVEELRELKRHQVTLPPKWYAIGRVSTFL